MPKLISCDWGTSALRLRLIDIDKVSVLAETISAEGISGTFELWKQKDKKDDKRLSFYQAILSAHIKRLEKQLNFSLQDMPLIISGMASSNIGLVELPYKEVPFSTDGNDLNIKLIEASADFGHTMLVLSGAKTMNDVMRGEETQLLGCLATDDKEDRIFIFPGTHSKHVMVKNGLVVDFKTYMTGEFFELLSKKSVLSNNVEETGNLLHEGNLKNFEKGVADSLHSNVLNSSFMVRTNFLFGKLSKQENYCYLSGLLVGTELKELTGTPLRLTVVSDELLVKLYGLALSKLGIHEVKYLDAGKAVIGGHRKIYALYKSKLTEVQ